jgi:hypothetical protein
MIQSGDDDWIINDPQISVDFFGPMLQTPTIDGQGFGKVLFPLDLQTGMAQRRGDLPKR